MKGILITKGVTPGFPPGALKIFHDNTGVIKLDANLHLHLDLVTFWLRISLDSFTLAKVAWKKAKDILKENPDNIPMEYLEEDFRQSMIVVISCAISQLMHSTPAFVN